MRKIIFIIVLGIAYWQWDGNGRQLPFMGKTSAVDAAGKPTTWIFTIDNCGDICGTVISELKNRRVPFEEKAIDPEHSDKPDYKLWQRISNENSFPLIVAGGNSTSGNSTQKLATLLGKTFGNTYLTYDEKRFFKKHFNADGSPRIIVYGTDWCPYCTAIRKEFKNNNVDFTYLNVETSNERMLLCQTMGIAGYPATWVGYTRVMKGDSYTEIMALAQAE